jgi:hypothetical protein
MHSAHSAFATKEQELASWNCDSSRCHRARQLVVGRGLFAVSPVPKCEGPGAPSSELEKVTETVATCLPSIAVSDLISYDQLIDHFSGI